MKRIFIVLSIAGMFVTCSAPDTGTGKATSGTSLAKPQSASIARVDADSIGRSVGLKRDLLKYNGFYTAVEMEGGTLDPGSLPDAVVDGKEGKPGKVEIQYLTKHRHGFILVFNMHYDTKQQVVMATLNQQYEMIDFVKYPNGNGNVDAGEDTLTFLSYDQNQVTVELMHSNVTEEPVFEIDGIYKEELTITDALKIEK